MLYDFKVHFLVRLGDDNVVVLVFEVEDASKEFTRVFYSSVENIISNIFSDRVLEVMSLPSGIYNALLKNNRVMNGTIKQHIDSFSYKITSFAISRSHATSVYKAVKELQAERI